MGSGIWKAVPCYDIGQNSKLLNSLIFPDQTVLISSRGDRRSILWSCGRKWMWRNTLWSWNFSEMISFINLLYFICNAALPSSSDLYSSVLATSTEKFWHGENDLSQWSSEGENCCRWPWPPFITVKNDMEYLPTVILMIEKTNGVALMHYATIHVPVTVRKDRVIR